MLPAPRRMTGKLTLGYREAMALAASPLARRRDPGPGARVPPHGQRARAGRQPGLAAERRQVHGWASDRLLASYLHVHWAGVPQAARRLVAAAITSREARAKETRAGPAVTAMTAVPRSAPSGR